MNKPKSNLSPQNLFNNSLGKTLVMFQIQDIKDENKKKEISFKLKENFEDPEKYFNMDDNIVIGKKITGPKYNQNGKVIARSVVGNPSIIDNGISTTSYKPVLRKHIDKKVLVENNFELINTNNLENLFNNARVRCTKSQEIMNIDLYNKNEDIKGDLLKQQKLLEKNKNARLETGKISNKVSEKINRNTGELLMNRQDNFRLKKQIKEIVEGHRPFEEKYGFNAWNIGLRRDKNQTRVRTAYINIGNAERENWKPIIEFPPKNVELIQRPQTYSHSDIKILEKSKYFMQKAKEINLNMEDFKKFSKIVVEGKNLLDAEYNLLSGIKGNRKIIYKDPYSEIPQNVNSKIIKENYDLKSKK